MGPLEPPDQTVLSLAPAACRITCGMALGRGHVILPRIVPTTVTEAVESESPRFSQPLQE